MKNDWNNKKKALAMFDSGVPLEEIIEILPVTEKTIRSYLYTRGVRGEGNEVKSKRGKERVPSGPKHDGPINWELEWKFIEEYYPNSPRKQDRYLLNKYVGVRALDPKVNQGKARVGHLIDRSGAGKKPLRRTTIQ